MFYEKQPKEQQENYKEMLKIMGELSNLFSNSESPYLNYRAHENIFCKYFGATNLGRLDNSADAKKGNIGIGLKTWIGQDDQKVAEFGGLRPEYENLEGLELVKQIAEYRNDRIRITKNMHGIDELVYHVVKRYPGTMKILEHVFDNIDIENIVVVSERGNDNNTYFNDGKHTYHFSISKNTLYMIFDDLEELDSFTVDIIDDPYSYLLEMKIAMKQQAQLSTKHEQLCLPLYSTKKNQKIVPKYVPEKSGLNQWNAQGRKRDINEIYIPYPAEDRNRNPEFFPPRDTIFKLILPDGKELSAKVCQEGGKAIMSNPNKELGKWLLRDVLELEEGTVITYQMLERFGIDSVIFTKLDELEYAIDFAETGTYEKFYGN